jgi:hypothetical protein
MSNESPMGHISEEDAKHFDELTEQIVQIFDSYAQAKPEIRPQVAREIKTLLIIDFGSPKKRKPEDKKGKA